MTTEGWGTRRIDEVVKMLYRYPTFYGLDRPSTGVPVVRGEHLIENGEISTDLSQYWFVSNKDSTRFPNTVLEEHDIVMAVRGTVGKFSRARQDHCGFQISPNTIRISPDPAKIHPPYLFFALHSREVTSFLLGSVATSAVPGIRAQDIKDAPLLLPPINEQKAIALLLTSLYDKIELNRKTNATLEAMAKALFKSWFVDFDPVKAKAEGRPTGLPAEISDLFPDSFEESELGEIPSGWGTTCLDELTSFVIGGDWGKDAWSETEQAKVLCLRGADIPSLQAFAMGKSPTRFLKESSCEKRTLVDGDIVLEISGGSTDQSTGRPVLISSELIKRAAIPLICSNFCRLIRFDDLRWSSYAYYLLLLLYQSGEMFQYETGTTGIKNFGYKYFAGGRFFPKPPGTLLDLFHYQVKSLHTSCHRRGEESDLLSQTRDALLPKLISGEIRIPDAEKMLEEVGI